MAVLRRFCRYRKTPRREELERQHRALEQQQRLERLKAGEPGTEEDAIVTQHGAM